MSKRALDFFGKTMMLDVRDNTIQIWDKILDGEMKGLTAEKVGNQLSNFSKDQVEVIKEIIPQIVDMVMHYQLLLFEENENINLRIMEDQNAIDLKEVSDGLAGELYTEDGWIMRFSKERYEEV